MSEEEKNKISYRFSGYQPPLIQLDSTGPAYWLSIGTHPYYRNQPQLWSNNAYIRPGSTTRSKKMYNLI